MKNVFFIFIATLFTTGSMAHGATSGKAFNPDISLNALFLYLNSNRGNDATSNPKNGASLDETEIAFTSDIDVYAKMTGIFSIHKESGEWKIEPEEAYAESLNLPFVTLKLGKFYGALGKYNSVHKHALPFIDSNLVNSEILGEEGLNEVGLSAAYLLPFVSWYSELTVQALNPTSTPYSSTQSNSSVFIGRLKNLFDLSDSLTMEIGVSGSTGPNDVDKQTGILGADLTFKWRPVEGGKYHAFIWSTEAMSSNKQTDPNPINTQGATSFVQWQMAERWWLQGRTEWTSQNAGVSIESKRKKSILIGFISTEFSAFRLQYDYTEFPSYDKPEQKVMLQANFSIGAHPAHAY